MVPAERNGSVRGRVTICPSLWTCICRMGAFTLPFAAFLRDAFPALRGDRRATDRERSESAQHSSYSHAPSLCDLVVIFNNGNTPAGNPNGQQLGVVCRPTGNSANGTAHLNCAEPTKVGDDIITGEPQCDFGRGPEECIPGAYIRTNDFPRISRNTQNNHLYAVWQDYRNGEYDIQLSISKDGGHTWKEAGTVNPDRGLDHYFPAVEKALPGSSDRVGVSYYRTQRIPNENTTPEGGFLSCNPNQGGDPKACSPGTGVKNSDYVLAGGTDRDTPYGFKVISPVFPPPDGVQAGFNGDYSGLTINKGTEAHPIWSDTRNADPYTPANGVIRDEDIFTDAVDLPNGREGSGRGGDVGSH